MKQILKNQENLSCWFRNCSVCRLSVPPLAWLCNRCWKKLKLFYLKPVDMIREQGGLTHVRLFDWGEENDFFARLFLNSLKNGGPFFIFETLAKEFLHRFCQVRVLPPQSVLIPAPSAHTKPIQDHAFFFCQAMSHVTGLAFQNPLSILNPKMDQKKRKQKQKNRKERREILLNVKEPFLLPHKTIIFVDDILTTGATARSAWRALGKPSKFIIFTLSWRRFLLEDKALISSQHLHLK